MKRSHFICLIASVAVMFLGPAIGLMATTLRMRRVIERLPPERVVEIDAELARELKATVPPTTAGVAVGVFGLVVALVVVGLHVVERRKLRRRGPTMRPSAGRGQ